MTFRLATLDGRAALVDSTDGLHDLETASKGRLGSDPMTALEQVDALHVVSAGLNPKASAVSLTAAQSAGRIGAPVPRPRSVFAVGLNYRSHAAESNMEVPENPLVFTKFSSCISGPSSDVVLPTKFGDYEVELVLVIGSEARNVPAERAWDHVLGLTVGQDVSDRHLQFAAKPPHFDLGKSRDTFGPTGPVLVSLDSFVNPADLAIRCEVNGEQRQADRTSSMIFDVPTLIAYLSSILTLRTGDLIFSGTPEGVGATTKNFLKPGDVIVSTIEGIGTMTNRCVGA